MHTQPCSCSRRGTRRPIAALRSTDSSALPAGLMQHALGFPDVGLTFEPSGLVGAALVLRHFGRRQAAPGGVHQKVGALRRIRWIVVVDATLIALVGCGTRVGEAVERCAVQVCVHGCMARVAWAAAAPPAVSPVGTAPCNNSKRSWRRTRSRRLAIGIDDEQRDRIVRRAKHVAAVGVAVRSLDEHARRVDTAQPGGRGVALLSRVDVDATDCGAADPEWGLHVVHRRVRRRWRACGRFQTLTGVPKSARAS